MRLTATGPDEDGYSPLERFLSRLEKVRASGGQHMACCPAHDDKNPSLRIREREDGVVLFTCFAGCEPQSILDAIGLEFQHLWPVEHQGRPNGSLRSRANLEHAKAVLAVTASDRAAGKPLTEFDLEMEAAAKETLELAGEDGPRETPPIPLPPTVPEFLQLEFEPQVKIMGPFHSHQLAIVHAPPGAGKTMWALNLAWHISEGKEFLGWACDAPHHVLVIDGEMAAHMQQSRLQCGGNERFRIANLSGWGADLDPLNLATEAGQLLVSHWIERTTTRVLILDNLMSLAWVNGVSINSDEFWTPVRRLCVLLRARGILVIIIDHSNITSGTIHGTKTKTWHADLVIRLTPQEAEEPPPGVSKLAVPRPVFRLSWDKVRDSGTDHEQKVITVSPVGQSWKWESGEDALPRMAREMKENGLSIREIAEQLGVSKSRVGRWTKTILPR